jgi:hypothetical protein
MKRLFIVLAAVAFGASTAFAGSVTVLYTGAEATAILAPGLYDITAYGAQGVGDAGGGLGAEMSAEFDFSVTTSLTLLAYPFPKPSASGRGPGELRAIRGCK